MSDKSGRTTVQLKTDKQQYERLKGFGKAHGFEREEILSIAVLFFNQTFIDGGKTFKPEQWKNNDIPG